MNEASGIRGIQPFLLMAAVGLLSWVLVLAAGWVWSRRRERQPDHADPRARALTGAIPWALLAIVVPTLFLLVIPRVEEVFTDFGVALPRVSILLINWSRAMNGSWPGTNLPVKLVMRIAVTLLLLGVTATVSRGATDPQVAKWAARLGWALNVGLLILVILGVGLPVASMLSSLNSSGSGI